MKKKSIKLLAGVAALGVLSGSYTLLRMQNEKNAEEEEIAALGEVILEVDDASVTGVSYQIGGETRSFVLEEETWKLESDETFPVDEDALLSPLNQLDTLYSVRTLTDVEDSSEYGMDEPQNVIVVTDADGVQTTLTIGSTNSSTGNDYLMLNGDETVIYTIDTAVRTAIADNLYEYALSEAIPWISATDISGVEVSRDADAYRLYLEDSLWKVSGEDGVNGADSDAVNTALSSLAGISYVDYLEHNCTDLSSYGLEDPAAVLTISYKEEVETESAESESSDGTETDSETQESYVVKELAFAIGDTDASGNYYVQMEGSKEVHTVLAGTLSAFLEGNQEEWAAEPESESETERESAAEVGAEIESAAEVGAETAAEAE